MSHHLSRLLRFARKPYPPSHKSAPLTNLQNIRSALRSSLDDCQCTGIDHLVLRIVSARNHQELWMLRCDAYRLIALSHCQAVASERINSLLHHFEGWIPAHEVKRSTEGKLIA